VTADDLGLETSRDHAIFLSVAHGLTTSASLLVGGGTAPQAAASAREFPALCLGLHLAFVQGRSVAAPDDVPTLTGRTGRLPASPLHLALANPRHNDLYREAMAQFLRFCDLVGRPPAFVNTHQHTQLLPSVRAVVIRLCLEHGIRHIRLPAEQHPIGLRLRPRAWLWPAAAGLAYLSRAPFRRAGLRSPDHMIGGPEAERLTGPRLLRLIAQIRPGVTELCCHPRAGSSELAALIAPQTHAALSQIGAERIPFDAL